MVTFLYYNLIAATTRSMALLTAGLFLLIESFCLWATDLIPAFAYLAGLAGAFILGYSATRFRSLEFRQVSPLLLIDCISYTIIIALTLFISRQAKLYPLHQLSKIDCGCGLFIFSVLLVVISVVFPSFNDIILSIKPPSEEKLRKPDWLPSVQFGWRRCITAEFSLLFFGCVAVVLLSVTVAPIWRIVIVMSYGILAPIAFEAAYGYRSYIMRTFCPTLFVAVATAMLLKTNYSTLVLPDLLNIMVAGWAIGFPAAMIHIWRNQNKWLLLTRQAWCHTIYISILGLGHAYVYITGIKPLVPFKIP